MYGNKMIELRQKRADVVLKEQHYRLFAIHEHAGSLHERVDSLHERVDRRHERACMNQVTACMMRKPASCSTGDLAVSTKVFIWKYVEHYGIGCTAVR